MTAPSVRGPLDRGRVGRVEVADHVVDVQAEAFRLVHPGVGRDDDCVVGQPGPQPGIDGIASGENYGRAGHAHPSLRRHYPEQVRGVGGGARRAHATLSARCPPSSPWVSCRAETNPAALSMRARSAPVRGYGAESSAIVGPPTVDGKPSRVASPKLTMFPLPVAIQ